MSLKYNSKFPLARLEKGDRAIIKVNNIYIIQLKIFQQENANI